MSDGVQKKTPSRTIQSPRRRGTPDWIRTSDLCRRKADGTAVGSLTCFAPEGRRFNRRKCKNPVALKGNGISGTPDWIRTSDLQSRSYQTVNKNTCILVLLVSSTPLSTGVTAPANRCNTMVCRFFSISEQ